MNEKGNDWDEEHTWNEADISPASIEKERRPTVIGMGDDIGKTDHHGKNVEDPVFLIQAQRQIDPKTDVHDVTEDQITVDFIGNMKIILP